MEEREYDWGTILKVSIPFSAIAGYFFYRDFLSLLRWAVLIIGSALAGYLVYRKDKRKANVFTAVAIVVLVSVVAVAVKKFGLL